MSLEPTPDPLPTMAYAVNDSRATDLANMKALAICHYVWGGLQAVFSCFGLIYVAMGIAVLNGSLQGFAPPPGPGGTPQPPDDRFFAIFFIVFGAIILLIGWLLAACTIAAGLSIARRRRRVFSIVIAAINCAMFPFGTVLGVFTLMVLLRDSVRGVYEDAAIDHANMGRSTST